MPCLLPAYALCWRGRLLASGGSLWLGRHAVASAAATCFACLAYAAARCCLMLLLCAPLAWAVLLAHRRLGPLWA
eukprot:9836471-Alexandrium_andersonii.AAC.1